MKYPPVLSEAETLELAHKGRSIARFGDGELKLALGRDAKSQRHDPELERWLRHILKFPPKEAKASPHSAITCIPNIGIGGPKLQFWGPFRKRPYADLYGAGTYGSAFITRPDSAPWINTDAYWSRVIDLWRDQHVILVRGSTKSLTAADLHHARHVEEIIAPRQHAFGEIDALFRRLQTSKRRVLLCLGATATVLAHRLGWEGVHALDLGHIGMFLRREGRFERESFPVGKAPPAPEGAPISRL